MYEHHSEPLLPRSRFVRRLVSHGFAAGGLITGALGLGVLGYHFLDGLPWLDALLNAAMILGGMGPIDPLHSVAAKLFASFYSLFSGIVFLVIAGLLVAPVAHRFLHHLHLEVEDGEDGNT